MLETNLVDGSGTKTKVKVFPTGALLVSSDTPSIPAQGTPSKFRFLAGLLGTTGLDSGTTNANVDGSSTPVEFCISSNADYDIRISQLVIVIADTAVVHSKFGNVTALTNGIDIEIVELGETTKLMDAAKTGGQVIAQSGLSHSYGDGATSFELTNWTGTEDAQTIAYSLHDFIPGGVRIGRGTKDKLLLRVNDDLTGLTEFTIRVIGYRQYA